MAPTVLDSNEGDAGKNYPEKFPHATAHPYPLLALLALVTIIAYLPAVRGEFVWDDDLYLTRNRIVGDPAGLINMLREPRLAPSPYPLLFAVYWLEHLIWGFRPMGYHLVNIGLHVCNAIFLAAVLKRLKAPGGLMAAFVFALHPVHVESVAWISELKNVMSGFFYLASLLWWIEFSGSGRTSARWISLAFFLLALLSKTVVCTLPVVAVFFHWRLSAANSGDKLRRAVRAAAPHIAAAAILSIVAAFWEREMTGATADNIRLAFGERILIAGRALWFYPAKLVWPAPLMAVYPKWDTSLGAAMGWVFPIVAGAAGVMLIRSRGGFARWCAVGAAYYSVTILPALGFVNYSTMIYSYAADHYQYLASLGWIVPLCGAARMLFARVPKFRWGAAAILCFALALRTSREAANYQNMESLFGQTLRANPSAWIASYNVGFALQSRGKEPEAEKYFGQCLSLKPGYRLALNALGVVRLHQGRSAEAIELFNRAMVSYPDYADALCHYAGFTHRRRVLFLKFGLIFVCDKVSVQPADQSARKIEQFWHFGLPTKQTGPGCFDIG
ncbi:tetratricopeptide repeat protein, partial [Candidatus Sumerlaeota bacterium]|nr:tetratricopeptide repeat protein [Candidatus Sumerlaeota bacterium]